MKVLILFICYSFAVVLSLPAGKYDHTIKKSHDRRSIEGPEDGINRKIFTWLSEYKKDVEDVIKKEHTYHTRNQEQTFEPSA